MKKINACMVISMIMVVFQLSVMAQTDDFIRTKSLIPYPISITCSKTTNLIFPFAIKSVDRGNSVVLSQKAKGVENILQIKASKPDFPQTNLTVITSDGQFYSFLVDYAVEPFALNISFTKDSIVAADLKDQPLTESEYLTTSNLICQQKEFLHSHCHAQKMKLSLQSVYLTHPLMWFKIKLSNRSFIDYHPDHIRFFLRDKKRSRRTAMQELEITPLFSTSRDTVVGKQSSYYVLAFTPFTVPSSQELILQVGEPTGGRSLVLHINHRKLLKARLLEELPLNQPIN